MSIRLLILSTVIAAAMCATPGASYAQVVPGEEHCVVNVRSDDALNMRSRPSASSRVVTTLRYGECGVIVMAECRGDWCPVEDGHDAGWVHSRFISMVSPAVYCVTGVAPGDRLNMRAFPAPWSRIITRLPRNHCDIAFLPYAVGNWQKVRTDGYEGWVHRRYVSGE